jgi:hypothetical protein
MVALPLWLTGGCADGDRLEIGPTSEAAQDAPAAVEGPETLRTVMSGLRGDMIRLSEGLWTGDFRTVAVAAEAVAEHPEVGPEERLRVQTALGGDFPDFVAADRRVHEQAMRVREAALREDTAAVLASLSDLQHGCIACHTTFRERLSP